MALCENQAWGDEAAESFQRSTAAAAASEYQGIIEGIRSGDEKCRVEAAKEIRRLTKTSSKHRRQLSGAVDPLVEMLRSGSLECKESALLALLNLAVMDERNKIKIVDAGALEPLVDFLQSANTVLKEHAAAAVLTLTASAVNRPCVGAAGAIPLLVELLSDGNPQAALDAAMALTNLATVPDNLRAVLAARPVPALVGLLRGCRKSSKMADKCSRLLEALLRFEEARTALTAAHGGVLAVVEVLEEGSLLGREHAVGGLLILCESDRDTYREAILNEGAIPGLLELTVQGTAKSQAKAQVLLQLLRESPYRRRKSEKFQPETFENIVCNIVSQIDGEVPGEKAKKMLAEMVQVSMQQSLRHLQRRALICIPPP
ncbi:unnamed protein product [Spirodela intermedia]|uniref:U-box domain-containing protein n=1 Tax=Spirodela intermedia TaxID=51605 RepID=A0A7I8J600_SPIIN|nr:unnamed protein product [Spirodela intermedia]CAA6665464.1 unnamed protein product [Spirodela intermedia]